METSLKKNIYVCVCVCVYMHNRITLLYTGKEYNSVNQLYFKFLKNELRERTKIDRNTSTSTPISVSFLTFSQETPFSTYVNQV